MLMDADEAVGWQGELDRRVDMILPETDSGSRVERGCDELGKSIWHETCILFVQ